MGIGESSVCGRLRHIQLILLDMSEGVTDAILVITDIERMKMLGEKGIGRAGNG